MGSGFGRSTGLSSAHAVDAPGGSDRFRAAFGDMTTRNADSGIGRPDPLAPLIGAAPQRHKGGFGDVLSTILAVAADATDPQGRGLYTKNLAAGWGKRGEAYDEKLAEYQARQRVANLPGMNEREMAAFMADPKAWGSNMSKAAVSPYEAATLNPGDQRFLGAGRGAYQAPTRGQQYAQSLDLQQGTAPYYNALRDQELGAQGPTAFQNVQRVEKMRQGNRVALEGVRQTNRTDLEGQRQGDRVSLEGVRQTNRADLKRIPPPPRLGTGRENLPTVNTPAEAMALPPGTKFRTRDGRIKIRP